MISIQHQAFVDDLVEGSWIKTPAVEAAFRHVPRHPFLPDVPLAEVYQNQVIFTKRLQGTVVSSSSQPGLMALMLEWLDLRPGHRVLEIGAGTGYNAALMAHVVGEGGQVVTLDIDEDLVDSARAHLETIGFNRVRVICHDGADGYPSLAPYDRIVLTVGARDIVPAWREQLRPHGGLVLPLRVRTGQVLVAFEPRADSWVSTNAMPCAFIEMRGTVADRRTPDPLPWLAARGLSHRLIPRQLFNLVDFRRLSHEGIRVRAYPIGGENIPSSNGVLLTRRWNRFLFDFPKTSTQTPAEPRHQEAARE